MLLEAGLYSYELSCVPALLHSIGFVISSPSVCEVAQVCAQQWLTISAEGSPVCGCCNIC